MDAALESDSRTPRPTLTVDLANKQTHQLWMRDSKGRWTKLADEGEQDETGGIAADSFGRLYVSDSYRTKFGFEM